MVLNVSSNGTGFGKDLGEDSTPIRAKVTAFGPRARLEGSRVAVAADHGISH